MTSSPVEQRTGFVLACLGTVVHAAFLLSLLVFCVWRVPAAERMLEEFGMTLPRVTQLVFAFSNWISANAVVSILAIALILSIDFGVMFLLGRYNRSAQLAWALVIALLLSAAGAFIVVATELPIFNLKEQLSH